jgi:hypothetical protein
LRRVGQVRTAFRLTFESVTSNLPITGADGELVERLVALLDRAPDDYPAWWSDYGLMVGIRVGVALPVAYDHQAVPRSVLAESIRQQLMHLIEEVDEAFLVRALRRDLDDFAQGSADTKAWDDRAAEFRAFQQQVIDDPEIRAEWRDRMTMQRPEYAGMSDDEMIADARRTLERSPMAQPVDADEAGRRWAASQAWLAASESLLGEKIIEHWKHLWIKQMDD